MAREHAAALDELAKRISRIFQELSQAADAGSTSKLESWLRNPRLPICALR